MALALTYRNIGTRSVVLVNYNVTQAQQVRELRSSLTVICGTKNTVGLLVEFFMCLSAAKLHVSHAVLSVV